MHSSGVQVGDRPRIEPLAKRRDSFGPVLASPGPSPYSGLFELPTCEDEPPVARHDEPSPANDEPQTPDSRVASGSAPASKDNNTGPADDRLPLAKNTTASESTPAAEAQSPQPQHEERHALDREESAALTDSLLEMDAADDGDEIASRAMDEAGADATTAGSEDSMARPRLTPGSAGAGPAEALAPAKAFSADPCPSPATPAPPHSPSSGSVEPRAKAGHGDDEGSAVWAQIASPSGAGPVVRRSSLQSAEGWRSPSPALQSPGGFSVAALKQLLSASPQGIGAGGSGV